MVLNFDRYNKALLEEVDASMEELRSASNNPDMGENSANHAGERQDDQHDAVIKNKKQAALLPGSDPRLDRFERED